MFFSFTPRCIYVGFGVSGCGCSRGRNSMSWLDWGCSNPFFAVVVNFAVLVVSMYRNVYICSKPSTKADCIPELIDSLSKIQVCHPAKRTKQGIPRWYHFLGLWKNDEVRKPGIFPSTTPIIITWPALPLMPYMLHHIKRCSCRAPLFSRWTENLKDIRRHLPANDMVMIPTLAADGRLLWNTFERFFFPLFSFCS